MTFFVKGGHDAARRYVSNKCARTRCAPKNRRQIRDTHGTVYTEIWYTQLGKTAYMNGSTFSYAYWPTPSGGTELQLAGFAYYFQHKDWLGNAPHQFQSWQRNHRRSSLCSLRRDLRQLRLDRREREHLHRRQSGHFRYRRLLLRHAESRTEREPRPLALARSGGPRSRRLLKPAELEPLRVCEQQPVELY